MANVSENQSVRETWPPLGRNGATAILHAANQWPSIHRLTRYITFTESDRVIPESNSISNRRIGGVFYGMELIRGFGS